MIKNLAGQKLTLFAIDTASGIPKTGDAANLTAYVQKDEGSVTALGDTSATEIDSTNSKGLYSFDLTQAETNADKLVFTGKSSTSGIYIVPVVLYTRPANANLLSIDASGNIALSSATQNNILSIFKADTDIKTLIANSNGAYTLSLPSSYPGTGTLTLKDKAGVTTLATITLNFDANKVVTSRTVA